jgi:hypothetical protein
MKSLLGLMGTIEAACTSAFEEVSRAQQRQQQESKTGQRTLAKVEDSPSSHEELEASEHSVVTEKSSSAVPAGSKRKRNGVE